MRTLFTSAISFFIIDRAIRVIALVIALVTVLSSFTYASAVPDMGGNCSVSQQRYDAYHVKIRTRPPTRLRIMGFRMTQLHGTMAGLRCSGVSLVAFDGLRFVPANYTDDLGIYYLVPRLAQLSGLSIEAATETFLLTIITVSFLMGLAGYLRFAKNRFTRFWGAAGFLALAAIQGIAGDIYILQAAIAVAFVPWIFYCARQKKFSLSMLGLFLLLGFMAGVSHLIRVHSATAVLLFAATLLAFEFHLSRRAKVVLVSCLLLTLSLPIFYAHTLISRRDSFLQHQQGAAFSPQNQHPFWHSVYIGFGFLSNSYVPAYKDEVALEKVRAISPAAEYMSPEYERILKSEVFNLVKNHPVFILKTLAAKLVVIGGICLLSVNFGVFAITRRPMSWSVNLAFCLAMGFSALFGILVVPNPQYLTGLIAFSSLYGIFSIQYAIEHRHDAIHSSSAV